MQMGMDSRLRGNDNMSRIGLDLDVFDSPGGVLEHTLKHGPGCQPLTEQGKRFPKYLLNLRDPITLLIWIQYIHRRDDGQLCCVNYDDALRRCTIESLVHELSTENDNIIAQYWPEMAERLFSTT